MRKGDIVELKFYDHASDTEDALIFVVWGRVCKQDKKHVVVQSWAHPDNLENDNQTECFSIIKSCIISSRVLS